MAHHANMDHVELVSKDAAATQKFLERAFSIKFKVHGPEMGNYRMHGKEEGAGTGTIGLREPMGPEPPGTISYLTVANIDDALTSAQSAGAHVIMGKTEIPGIGFSAVLVAPGEVPMGLYQNLRK